MKVRPKIRIAPVRVIRATGVAGGKQPAGKGAGKKPGECDDFSFPEENDDLPF